MLQFISQDQQIRKKVFFKPELSSQIKFTPMISPQFINDTTLLYMSAYDFMEYDTDEESFSLIHRPLISQNQTRKCEEEFINVNFGHDGRQRINEIFYLIKTTSIEEQAYFLGRRTSSVNHEYDRRMIARNKREKKKKYTISDIDNRGNVKSKKQKEKAVTFVEQEIPAGILEIKKEFIVKQNLSLIVFVVKKEFKQPEIKLSVKRIPEEENDHQQDELDQHENPSPPTSERVIFEQKQKKQKEFKNHLLIHSYAYNQTMTFELEQSIESAFQVSQGSPNIICVTEKHVYLLNFQVKNTYMSSYQPSSMSNFDFDDTTKNTYQDSKRGYLNSDIKIEILDKFQLEFQIKTQGHLPDNFFNPTSKSITKGKDPKKKQRRNQSFAHNSIVRDKRVSSLLKKDSHGAKRKSQLLQQKPLKFSSNIQQPQYPSNPPPPIEQQDNYFSYLRQPLMMKKKTTIKQQPQDQQPNQQQQQPTFQPSSIKIIKKALKVLPLSFHQDEFIMVVYVISKVLCTSDSIQTLSFSYESTILAVSNVELVEVNVSQYVINNANGESFMSSMNNGGSANSSSGKNRQGEDEASNNNTDGGDFKNIFDLVTQLGDIVAHKGVILIWQKSEPVIHEVVFKLDYRTSQMLDLSEPKNLKTQKTIIASISYSLQYHNKITLHLNSNLIRHIIISPTCQNFLILTGRNHSNNNYRESELEYMDTKPEDIDEKYDVDDYLIFQYDLFAELWSSDANVYLKNIPISYHKRRVEEVAPFRMKNQVLALTGKKVHEIHKSLLDGILYFDLHPYGYFIAVSFGFNAKIYSLQHSTLNLIYTYNSQNIKKIKYSPSGSDLVVMSQKNIKILDSYSFSIKYILQEKSAQCSFTNFGYSFTGLHFYTVYDNVFINIHDGHSYNKSGSIKPGQSSLLGFHDKIVTIIPDSQAKFCLALLETGKIYFKWNEDVIAIQHERMYEYEDGKQIKAVHFDAKRGVLFCGLDNGTVRAHIWPIKNEASYDFNTYAQFKFSYCQITVLSTSYLTNTLYVGDDNGNLTTAKFIIEKEKKITGQIRPSNYYIFSSHSPLVNMPKTQLQALEKCYKYVLSSNTTSMAESPEKLKLEYKLNEIITRMNEQMKKFKKVMREKLIEKECLAKNKLNFNKLYNQTKGKLSQITHQIRELKEREDEEKYQLNNSYQQSLKKVIEAQNQLIKQKGLQLSKNFMAKTFLRQLHINELSTLKEKQTKMQNQYSAQGIKGIQLMIREEELVPYDEMDYLPNWKIDIKKELIQKLDDDLVKEQERNYQLKQACTYMENSKNNLQMGRIKEETVIFRINLELQEMDKKLQYQKKVRSTLAAELAQAQQKINKTQVQVVQRNPQFTKVVSGNSGSDDGCTYKLWVKDRMSEQVELLYNHYNNLGEIMEQKQIDIVEMVTFRKKFVDTVQSQEQKKIKMKQYLHFLKDRLTSLMNQTNEVQSQCAKYESLEDRRQQVSERKQELQRAKQKEKCFQETKHFNLSIMDLVAKKMKQQSQSKKRNSHKTHTTRSLTKSKDQDIIVREKKQGHRILLQNCTSKKAFEKKMIEEENSKEGQNKGSGKRQLSTEMRTKINRLVEEIDDKVKSEWSVLQNEKLSVVMPFKSSSNKCLTKRLRKLKSEVRITSTTQCNTFTQKLLERLRQKEEQEHQNQNALLNDKDLKKEQTIETPQSNRLQRVFPFSATSSPMIRHISSQFNLYEKSSKFLKNNVKIQQRKVKRLNGQKAELLSEYEQLKYENKELSDQQGIIKDGIDIITDMIAQQNRNDKFLSNDQQDTVKLIRKTPFQKYVEQKSHRVSPNKTITQLKENFTIFQIKNLSTSKSSRKNLNLTSTAFNTPKLIDSPRKITQRMFSKK